MKQNTKFYITVIIFVVILALSWFLVIHKNSQQNYVGETHNTENPAESKYVNSDLGFTVTAPEGWYHATKGVSTATALLNVVFSDDKNFIELGPLNPNQPYPQKWANLVVYETEKTVEAYANENLSGRQAVKVSQNYREEIPGIKTFFVKSTYNNMLYLSAYTKKENVIYIFESLVPQRDALPETESLFETLVLSLSFTE